MNEPHCRPPRATTVLDHDRRETRLPGAAAPLALALLDRAQDRMPPPA